MSVKPYSRMYWSVMDDPKFDGVREDVRLFGAWALFLLYADMSYPAPTYRPPTISIGVMNRLVAQGLVDELSGKRYRIHGLASEREMRSHNARNAAASRWNMPSKSKSKAEQEIGMRPHANTVDRDPLLREIRETYKAKDRDS
jgi:hypothetical protein